LEGLLVRHAAPLQGLVEIRHRGPEPRGCVLSVDRVREAVQERGHLLREHLEHLFHFARFHSVFLLTHSVHLLCPTSQEAGPGIWARRALVTMSRPLPPPPGTSGFPTPAWRRRSPHAASPRAAPSRSGGRRSRASP